MKVALLLCLFAVGSQADFFGDLGHAFSGLGQVFTDTFHQVAEQGKTVGGQLLEQAKQQGTQLASSALQHLLLGTMNALNGQQPTDQPTKRDLVNMLTQLVPVDTEAKAFVKQKFDQMHGLFNATIGRLEETAQGFHEKPVHEIFTTVDNIVDSHHFLLDHLKNDLVNGLTNILGKVLVHLPDHKRSSFTDALTSLGHSLASFFQPHLDALNQVVSGVGDSLKNTTSTFAAGIDPAHTDALKESTSAIVQHGTNALAAAKDALTDIFHAEDQRRFSDPHLNPEQTLTNMQPHLHNIINHGAAALHQGINALGTNPTPES